ncbi:MAG: hypothetical protein OEV15_07835, partial [Gallionella sp.]|nr:hypothetical protein [Gallionella sp.]
VSRDVAAMTRRCEASGAGMAASHPLPQTAGFATNVSRDVRSTHHGAHRCRVGFAHHVGQSPTYAGCL